MDLLDDAQLDAAYAQTIERFGSVDVLINNAALVFETLFAPMGHVKTLDTKDNSSPDLKPCSHKTLAFSHGLNYRWTTR
jgi:NAD(P)-dependent dehydrogenase (short-subunit alcohol dehydrogenase family)